MTLEELKKLQFRMESHIAMADEHITTYINEQYGFVMCKRTKKKDEFTYGRTITHYMFRGVVYKSLPKFLEAIKDVNYIENQIFGKKK